jgi:hypothetical protein
MERRDEVSAGSLTARKATTSTYRASNSHIRSEPLGLLVLLPEISFAGTGPYRAIAIAHSNMTIQMEYIDSQWVPCPQIPECCDYVSRAWHFVLSF